MSPRYIDVPANDLQIDDVLMMQGNKICYIMDILRTKDHVIIITNEMTETVHPRNSVRKLILNGMDN